MHTHIASTPVKVSAYMQMDDNPEEMQKPGGHPSCRSQSAHPVQRSAAHRLRQTLEDFMANRSAKWLEAQNEKNAKCPHFVSPRCLDSTKSAVPGELDINQIAGGALRGLARFQNEIEQTDEVVRHVRGGSWDGLVSQFEKSSNPPIRSLTTSLKFFTRHVDNLIQKGRIGESVLSENFSRYKARAQSIESMPIGNTQFRDWGDLSKAIGKLREKPDPSSSTSEYENSLANGSLADEMEAAVKAALQFIEDVNSEEAPLFHQEAGAVRESGR